MRTAELDALTKDVFYGLMRATGKVYLLVGYSEGVSIGRRGFLVDERERGLVLVFTERMIMEWAPEGINTTLTFGGLPERCHIPYENILAVYSPEAGAQFVLSPRGPMALGREDGLMESRTADADMARGNIIEVDFKRR